MNRFCLKSCCLLLLMVAFNGVIFAQNSKFTIIDEMENPIVGANVQDTIHQSIAYSDRFGNVSIPSQDGSVLKVTHIGYKTAYISIQAPFDTLRQFISLTPEINLLEQVDISSSTRETVVAEKLTSVLDYIPFNEFIAVLKSYRGKQSIALVGMDTTYVEYALDKINALSLFEDCFGNIHILSNDSCYQIWMDNGLHFVDVVAIEKYETLLHPCVGNFQNATAHESFSNYNKRYRLETVNKESHNTKLVLDILDSDAEKVAAFEYWKIINYYNAYAPPHANIIRNGVWNGNLIALQLPADYELNRMITWYLKVRGREIKVSSFQEGERMVSFDVVNDIIYIFNGAGEAITQVKNQPSEGYFEGIVQDKMNYAYYEINRKGNKYSLSQINLSNGMHQPVLFFPSIPENIQVYDSWAYYTSSTDGAMQLHRESLIPSP